MGQEPDAASSRLAAAGSSRHRVKREGQGAAAAAAGVKREREDGDAAPRSATAETVDLTAQVREAAFLCLLSFMSYAVWQLTCEYIIAAYIVNA